MEIGNMEAGVLGDEDGDLKYEILRYEELDADTEPSLVTLELQFYKQKLTLIVNPKNKIKEIKFTVAQSALIMTFRDNSIRTAEGTFLNRDLAKKSGISERSIPVYISNINKFFNNSVQPDGMYGNLIVSAATKSGRGYMLNPSYLVYLSNEH